MTAAMQSQLIRKSADLNCEHVDAMKCIAKNQDVCGESPLGGDPDCLCTACPCYFDVVSASTASTEESGMKHFCRMIPYTLCVLNAPECDGSMNMSSGDGEAASKEQIIAAYEAQKSQCGADLGPECVPGGASDTSGSMLSPNPSLSPSQSPSPSPMQTCGNVKSAYKAAGCCGNPNKDFTTGDMKPRRLSEDELLESVKAALQKQKVERGSSSSLSKAIDDVVKNYIEKAA